MLYQIVLMTIPFILSYIYFFYKTKNNKIQLRDTPLNRLHLLFAKLEDKCTDKELKQFLTEITEISENSKSLSLTKFDVFNQFQIASTKHNLFLNLCEKSDLDSLTQITEYIDAKDLILKSKDINGLSPFHLACYNGNLEMVKYLIEISREKDFSKDLFSLKSNGFTGFHLSVSKGNENVVHYLLELDEIKETCVEEEDSQGNSPLIISCCNKLSNLVELFLEKGAKLNINKQGRTALHFACMNRYYDIAKLIVEYSFKTQQNKHKEFINISDNINSFTPLHISARAGNFDLCDLLIKNGAEVNSFNKGGETPIHLACSYSGPEYPKVVKFLISKGASYYKNLSVTPFGKTAIHEAARAGNYECLLVLLEHASKNDIDPFSVRDFDGETPLHDLVLCYRRKGVQLDNILKCLDLFLSYKTCDVNTTDYTDATPFHRLCYCPNIPLCLKIAEILLEKGSNPTKEDIYGWCSLHASYYSEKEMEGESVQLSKKLQEMIINNIKSNKNNNIDVDLFFSNFNKQKPKNLENRVIFTNKSGPHNLIPIEDRKNLLGGEININGIAKYLLKIAETRKPKIVFATGAGISVSSGIPDFRSRDTGLYSKKETKDLFTLKTLMLDSEVFYQFLKFSFSGIVKGDIKPSITHKFIGLIEKKGWLSHCFTQNVDMLDLVSKESLCEAHGSFRSFTCTSPSCLKFFDSTEEIWETIQKDQIPKCPSCKSILRPDVTFFGEPLRGDFNHRCKEYLKDADLLIVMGTTLVVYPFASILKDVGLMCPRLLINREATGPFKDISNNDMNYRDCFLEGECDEGVLNLAESLGMKEDLLNFK